MSCNRKLITLALGTALISPIVLAQSPVANVTGQATANVAQIGNTPVLPTQANPRASDAISARTTIQENRPIAPRASANANVNANVDANANTMAGSNGISSSTAGMRADANMPPAKGNWWKDTDTNGDGKISAAEAVANAGLNSHFSVVDTNKDGFVSQDEYRAYFTSNASQGAEHAAAHSAVVTRDLWLKLDANGDTRLSPAEVAANAGLKASFSAMDSNHDGFVTQAEYRAYAKKHK